MNIRIKLTILTSFVFLGMYGFNCSKNVVGQGTSGRATDSSITGQVPQTDNSDFISKTIDSPVTLLNYFQVFKSMLNVTNMGNATGNQLNEFRLRTTLMPTTNDLSMLNSPGFIASTSIGGEVCLELVNRERAKAANLRQYFPLTDFTKGVTLVTDQQVADTVELLAEHFWGRQATSAEVLLFVNYKKDYYATLNTTALQTSGAQTINMYVGLCSAMLASFEFVTY